MLKNPQSPASDSGQTLRMLAYAVVAGACLIFAGLGMLAVSVSGQSGNWAMAVLTDRSIHYILMVAIVAYYVYFQSK